MDVYVDEKLGGDGGRVQLVNDEGVLKLQLSFPFKKIIDLAIPKVREPAIAMLKKAIPGERFDGLAVSAVDGILRLVGYEAEKHEAPKVPDVPAVPSAVEEPKA